MLLSFREKENGIMNDIILTICIPTYNRSFYLDRSLFYITSQIERRGSLIEIIILDNDSIDDTYDIVHKYIQLGFPINYIKNEYNLGADKNVDKCYQLGNGKYVLALGDDDILVLDSINKLLSILEDSDYGVVHLTSKSISSNDIYKIEKSFLKHRLFYNHNLFFNTVGYNITFISANIVNRKYYKYEIVPRYNGSNLPQIPYIISSILNANSNLIIDDPILMAQVDNSGGYNLFTVFGVNFNKILLELSVDYPGSQFYKIITNKLLVFFFPFWIIKLKRDKIFEGNSQSNILLPLFKRNYRFWIFCFPLMLLPYYFAVIYHFVILLPNRVAKCVSKILN